MRGIKFRAWDTEQREWLYFVIESTQAAMDDPHCFNFFGSICDGNLLRRLQNWSQHTGLHDKNGVEIYEGDLLSHHEKVYRVQWDGYMSAFQAENIKDKIDADFFNWGHIPGLRTKGVPTFSSSEDPNCEVIGNVYENPELLTPTAARA